MFVFLTEIIWDFLMTMRSTVVFRIDFIVPIGSEEIFIGITYKLTKERCKKNPEENVTFSALGGGGGGGGRRSHSLGDFCAA